MLPSTELFQPSNLENSKAVAV